MTHPLIGGLIIGFAAGYGLSLLFLLTMNKQLRQIIELAHEILEHWRAESTEQRDLFAETVFKDKRG